MREGREEKYRKKMKTTEQNLEHTLIKPERIKSCQPCTNIVMHSFWNGLIQ